MLRWNESYVRVDWKHHRKSVRSKRTKFALTSHRESTETPLLLEFLRFPHGRLGRKHDRLGDETVLVSLHLSHHLCLVFSRAVVVDDSETSQERHVDGHVVLRNSVHGGGEQRGLQRNTLGDWHVKRDLRSGEACKRC